MIEEYPRDGLLEVNEYTMIQFSGELGFNRIRRGLVQFGFLLFSQLGCRIFFTIMYLYSFACNTGREWHVGIG